MEKQNTIINLKSLFDLSEKLNSAFEEKFIFNSVLLSLMGKFAITKAAVFLPDNRTLKQLIIKGECNITKAEIFDVDSFQELDINNNKQRVFLKCGYRYVLPIRDSNNILALVFLGKKVTEKQLSEIEFEYAKLVSTIASIAINNTKNYDQVLKEKVKAEQKSQLLETLFSITKDFSLLLTKDKILNMLTYNLMGQLMVNRFAVILKDDNNNPEIITNRFDKEPSLSMLREITKLEKCATIAKLFELEKLDKNEYHFLNSIKAGVLSPMQVSGESKGWIVIGEKLNGEKFTDENLQFIEAISNTAITALENERLVEEEIRRKQLENEMNLALDIQKGLLPKQSPNLENYDIYGTSIPSRSVGGDYFDHIKFEENKYLILIADVSGKGLPAAMIMANLQSSLRLLAPMNLNLNKVVNSVSKLLFENTSSDKFVTMFIAILDTDKNELEYINAGHNPPLLLKNGELHEKLSAGGLILGLLEDDFNYESGKIKFEAGDLLFLYTDGITENKNSRDEEFGEERLQEYLESNYEKNSEGILKELIKEMKLFSYGSSQYDDITAIALKFHST